MSDDLCHEGCKKMKEDQDRQKHRKNTRMLKDGEEDQNRQKYEEEHEEEEKEEEEDLLSRMTSATRGTRRS